MRKQVFGRGLKRDTNERKALFKGLMSSLVMLEAIQTTEEKAKAIKGKVEKLITKAKKRGKEAKKFLQPYLSTQAVDKVMRDLSVRFAKRPGGYTRIVKLGNRFSDNASIALIEWVEKPVAITPVTTPEKKIAKKEEKKQTVSKEEKPVKKEIKKTVEKPKKKAKK